jgi:O-antigen/teichoic acid export membrane protein
VGIYLEKKTKYLPFLSGAGAIINVAANFLLIPRIGILGAALSTLLSYIVMAVGMYLVSQRFYHVEYEWSKVGKIVGLTMVLFVIFRFIHPEPINFAGIIVKIVIVISYICGLVMLKIIDAKEIAGIKTYIKNYLNHSQGPISME